MKKFKFNLDKVKKLLSRNGKSITIFLAIIIFTVGLVFLYDHFVRTLNDVKKINLLKNQVSIKVLNMDAWQKINDHLEWKTQPLIEEDFTKNPF